MENKKPIKSEFILIKSSGIHNKGVFAKKFIPKGTKIIEYIGNKITKKQAEEIAEKQYEQGQTGKTGHVYIFELNKKYDLDGNVKWNTARLINHSCNPNCETEQDENEKIWIIAMRDIEKGEELSYDYGYDLDNWKEHPCRCQSQNCIGYIVGEKHRKKLNKILENK